MVLLSLRREDTSPKVSHWTLNRSILKNPVLIKDIGQSLLEYFEHNDTDDISPETLWAAHKASIRGKIIQLAANLKKQKNLEIKRLEINYLDLCRKHKTDPHNFPTQALDAARSALNLVLTTKAGEDIKWTGANFYKFKDKIGPMLAHKLSPRFQSRTLPKIKMIDGSFSLNPRRIMEAFHDFYSKLYTSTEDSSSERIDDFLSNLNLPKLSEIHTEVMEAPISIEEVSTVIKHLKLDKAPGPDGFSSSYYKTFSSILTPYLVRFFNHMTEGDPIERQLNLAYISVIPKPEKDHSLVENYRPISLINNDLKILTKIMAIGYLLSLVNMLVKIKLASLLGGKVRIRLGELLI